jgi:ComF family protein
MPVPLHWRREWQRGYNQSLLIAQPLSKWLNIPLDSTSLQRLRHTPPQHELSGAKRRRNLKNAFHYSPALPYRKIALVDDVVTTGSTMNTISQLLHQHGVEEVQVWCLARA